MKTFVLLSQKGGSGKSTLARNLAVEAARLGGRVAIIDADKQGSLAAWWQAREADDIDLIQTPARLTDLPDLVGAIKKKRIFDYLIVDTAGADDAKLSGLLKAASLAVVPVQPSPDDLRAVNATLAMLDGTNTPYVFVLSRAGASRILDASLSALEANGRVAPTIVKQRVAYAYTAHDGKGVCEGPDKAAAREIEELWAFIEGQA